MVRGLILVIAMLCVAPSAFAQSSATLRAIDVYRSSALPAGDARKRFGAELREIAALRNSRRPSADKQAEALRRRVELKAARTPGVASVEVHLSEYYTSVDHALYAVFDVVDAADSFRLSFTPTPKARIPDPDGLLAAWKSFVDLGEMLSRRGQMPVERPVCPGFYCLWGGTPELDAAHKRFVDGAENRGTELRRVLSADADGGKRAAALFVLSYQSAGEKVTRLCREALSDHDARVRGAALQILADIVNNHKDVEINLDAVLPRLDDPAAGVRGKAMGLLVPLAEKPAYRKKMFSAAPRLAVLMRVEQPESRDLSFTLLGLISGKNWDRLDFAAWDAWAAKAAAGKPD
ncbi:MAG: hypothetical protein AAB262_06625 [Elusimicrobiota bacterium]